jgi:cytochrome o ubiquinol oxidase subunit 2
MNKKTRVSLIAIAILGLLVVAVLYLHSSNIEVLNPKGPIAAKERNLLFFGLGLSAVVVIPVFTMVFLFAWKYRESNKGAKYSPHLDGNRFAEVVWWGIPTVIIGILSVVAWNSSHTLDPFRPIASVNKAMTIQVVAMDWKWLFIYPQQNIASINYLQFPSNTPINFEITSDAPMNSFWIPQLGGQIYAMPGMSTQLNLLAYRDGAYRGSSANISGQGFAGMDFTAVSTSPSLFQAWVNGVRTKGGLLTAAQYNNLSKPSENNAIAYYSYPDQNLYNSIVTKYTGPVDQMTGMGM